MIDQPRVPISSYVSIVSMVFGRALLLPCSIFITPVFKLVASTYRVLIIHRHTFPVDCYYVCKICPEAVLLYNDTAQGSFHYICNCALCIFRGRRD